MRGFLLKMPVEMWKTLNERIEKKAFSHSSTRHNNN
jgi:hypothetical protein